MKAINSIYIENLVLKAMKGEAAESNTHAPLVGQGFRRLVSTRLTKVNRMACTSE